MNPDSSTRLIWDDDLQLMKPILLRDSPIGFRRRLNFRGGGTVATGKISGSGSRDEAAMKYLDQ